MKQHNYLYIKLWFTVLFYILIAGFLFQLVLLPYVFPSLHGGDGLLKGGDWLYFQRIALDLVEEMDAEGWSAWQLRPADQAPAGIAAAIYKITGIAKPWTILPLNAIVHATSAIILLLIVGTIAGWDKPSVWPALPFSFFPTALLWNTQFHKDGLFILGSFLFLYGLLAISAAGKRQKIPQLLVDFALLVSGIILVWIVRPYGAGMILYVGIIVALVATVALAINFKKERINLLKIGILWLAFIFTFQVTALGTYEQLVEIEYTEVSINNDLEAISANEAETVGQDITEQDDALAIAPGSATWRKSAYLPAFIDETLYDMAVLRERYLVHKPEAGSNIDHHIRFNSAGDLIKYIPRAAVIGLLAPFPGHWFVGSPTNFSELMRLASSLEMFVSYLALLGLILGFWLWRKKLNLYLTVGFSVGMILTYAMVVANLGTLYRMRYGFMMILVAVGIQILHDHFTKKYSIHKRA